jgi:hypothetical protein
MRRLPSALALLLLAPPVLPAQSLAPRPAEAVRTGSLQDPDLRESSGVAFSRRFPGVLFTLNDSGNPAEIFATDSSGRPRGRWLIPGLRNRDWEALSIGPCPAGSCLYIGDVGDNEESQPSVALYRVTLPADLRGFRGEADPTAGRADSALVRYPDGPHDAEAIWVDDAGGLLLVSKGRSGPIRLYRVPASAFQQPAVVTAELLQTLPIEPDRRLGRWVTDGARSPDGRRVALRTYTELYLFPVQLTGRLGPPVICNIAGLEPQGEGVAWLDDRRLVLTSEAPTRLSSAPIHIVRCDG